MQKLITKPIREKLIANFKQAEAARLNADENGDFEQPDFAPALKLFCPWGAATWLISELDPDTNIAFGLAYLGGSKPELGLISIDELTSIKHISGLRIERDIYFDSDGQKLSVYAREAKEAGYIAV